MNPRILLVEDDPTSRAFLQAATEALPACVDVAATMADAITLATGHAHALWLFDAHLPDGSGSALLARLREHGLATPAIAHTASHERAAHDALLAAGFDATIAKPLPGDSWREALRAVLGDAAGAPTPGDRDTGEPGIVDASIPTWDEAAALSALAGNPDNVAALRRLFLDELPMVRDALTGAAERGDVDAMRADLHRLRASCGFVGAARLDAAASMLREAPLSKAALRAFLDAAQDALSPG